MLKGSKNSSPAARMSYVTLWLPAVGMQLNPLNPHDASRHHVASLKNDLKRHNQAKIIKKSVILFWLLNMTK